MLCNAFVETQQELDKLRQDYAVVEQRMITLSARNKAIKESCTEAKELFERVKERWARMSKILSFKITDGTDGTDGTGPLGDKEKVAKK